MSHSHTQQAKGHGASAIAQGKEVDIHGLSVLLPDRFSPMVGKLFTDDLAKIVYEHVSGQFRNNQIANAKARAKRYAEAENDAEREENKPWTADQYLAAWADYMPTIGGARQSNAERNRMEAAKRAWAKIIADHNARIDAGEPGILKSTEKQRVAPRPKKTKDISTEQHEENVKAWQEGMEATYAKLLANARLSHYVQAELDAIEAEQGKEQAEEQVSTAGADLLD